MSQMNWQSGRIDLLLDVDEGPSWSLVVGGDFALLGEHIQAMICDPMCLYGDLQSALQGGDLAVVNTRLRA